MPEGPTNPSPWPPFSRDEECAHSNYDLVFFMMERNSLIYLAPKRFITRRLELLQKKPGKEIVLDQNTLTIKDKQRIGTLPSNEAQGSHL